VLYGTRDCQETTVPSRRGARTRACRVGTFADARFLHVQLPWLFRDDLLVHCRTLTAIRGQQEFMARLQGFRDCRRCFVRPFEDVPKPVGFIEDHQMPRNGSDVGLARLGKLIGTDHHPVVGHERVRVPPRLSTLRCKTSIRE